MEIDRGFRPDSLLLDKRRRFVVHAACYSVCGMAVFHKASEKFKLGHYPLHRPVDFIVTIPIYASFCGRTARAGYRRQSPRK